MAATILVVDDEADFLEYISFHLRQRGHAVLTAREGEEALHKARQTLPDLILLDLMLPGIDGLTVCDLLRRNETTRSIPTLILSALPTHLARLHRLAAGAVGFLSKSLSTRQLLERVEAVLQGGSETARPQAVRAGVSKAD